jgi:hypothetical protein
LDGPLLVIASWYMSAVQGLLLNAKSLAHDLRKEIQVAIGIMMGVPIHTALDLRWCVNSHRDRSSFPKKD